MVASQILFSNRWSSRFNLKKVKYAIDFSMCATIVLLPSPLHETKMTIHSENPKLLKDFHIHWITISRLTKFHYYEAATTVFQS